MLESDGDRSTCREVVAVRHELSDHRRFPETAVEEDHCGAVGNGGTLGGEDVGEKIGATGACIHIARGGFQDLLVARLTDGCDLLQYLAHNGETRQATGGRRTRVDLFVVIRSLLSNRFGMNRYILAILLLLPAICHAQGDLRVDLERTYGIWRAALVNRDAATWQRVTAEHRRVEVRNRIVSEKRAFPAAVFDLPAPPPLLAGLKFLEAKQNGATAKSAYFGKIDFGVGGEPTDNLLVLSFVRGAGGWLYDKADFVNLAALPDVRAELAAGDLSYLRGVPEAQPSGVVPPTPIAANPATTIAKAYVFCPGREVQLQVNKISRHRFANAKEAEIVIGGARPGLNEVQYAIRKLEGGTGEEAMVIRIYLLSETPGVKPLKAFEYLVPEKGATEAFGTGTFVFDAAMAAKLIGK